MELAYIFGWDVDFALDIRKGDHFKVIYDEHYLDGDKIDDGDILAAEFTNQGKTFRAVRFADAEVMVVIILLKATVCVKLSVGHLYIFHA